jgi:hypothetical protein
MQDPRRDALAFGTTGYDSRGSGALTGGGSRRHRRGRRTRSKANLPYVRLGDRDRIRELPDFDPRMEYTGYDLAMLAEKILLEDPKPATEDPMYLHPGMMYNRQKREIYVGSGTPDPAIASGLYNRTHPLGRRYRSKRERELNGDSFYT